MIAALALNLAWLLVLGALSVAYGAYVAPLIASDIAALIVNMLAAFLLGGAAFLVFRGPVFLKATILIAIPVSHVFIFGGDPAKPGLEYEVAIAEYLLMLLGLVVFAGIHRFLLKKHDRNLGAPGA